MGGLGSGRHGRRFGAKVATDSCRSLDVRRWQRDGWLRPGRTFNLEWTRGGTVEASIQVRVAPDQLILSYQRHDGSGDWVPMEYPVRLDWTACHFGGRRAWFECPGAGCGRRVAILYLVGGEIFACRCCLRLAYACQRERADDRAARRADKIRVRLGWGRGILGIPGGRPRGMHWGTFWRLKDQHDVLVSQAVAGMAERLELLNGQLESLHADSASRKKAN